MRDQGRWGGRRWLIHHIFRIIHSWLELPALIPKILYKWFIILISPWSLVSTIVSCDAKDPQRKSATSNPAIPISLSFLRGTPELYRNRSFSSFSLMDVCTPVCTPDLLILSTPAPILCAPSSQTFWSLLTLCSELPLTGPSSTASSCISSLCFHISLHRETHNDWF